MKCRFINVLMFAAGAAIGSVVTWKLVEAKYERLVQEEIESIRGAFSEEQTDEEDDESDTGTNDSFKQINWEDLEDLDDEDEDDDEYLHQRESDIAKAEYEKLTSNYTSEKGGAEKVVEKPYVIAPYDFGELDGYSQIELTYYADGVLEDDEYNIVSDVDELIGSDSLFTFGEYEDDAVFVRNERLRTDFQILRDYRTYDEARSASPNQVGHE